MNKLNENIPFLKKINLRKKEQEKEDEIKRQLQTANQNWNDWRFQINWNKVEWVNPRNNIEQNNSFCVSFKNICFKYNNKNEHWVVH